MSEIRETQNVELFCFTPEDCGLFACMTPAEIACAIRTIRDTADQEGIALVGDLDALIIDWARRLTDAAIEAQIEQDERERLAHLWRR